jgi:hypothetical protein
MPVISRFFGVIIYMYWRDHVPPHFHARYQDQEAAIAIETGEVSGELPRRALTMVEEWRQTHKEELLEDWKLAEQKKVLRRIEPLE